MFSPGQSNQFLLRLGIFCVINCGVDSIKLYIHTLLHVFIINFYFDETHNLERTWDNGGKAPFVLISAPDELE